MISASATGKLGHRSRYTQTHTHRRIFVANSDLCWRLKWEVKAKCLPLPGIVSRLHAASNTITALVQSFSLQSFIMHHYCCLNAFFLLFWGGGPLLTLLFAWISFDYTSSLTGNRLIMVSTNESSFKLLKAKCKVFITIMLSL